MSNEFGTKPITVCLKHNKDGAAVYYNSDLPMCPYCFEKLLLEEMQENEEVLEEKNKTFQDPIAER